MLRKTVILVLLNFILCPLLSQDSENGLVKWLTIKEAQEKNKIAQRPFIIDFYTDWCGWCKHMMRTTYSNQFIADYINTNFYPVKFNAEGKDTIEYNGVVYKPISNQPKTPHEFAIKMLGQQLSYPSTIFVTNNFQYSLLTQGYLEVSKIEPLLVFMVENVWRSTSYDEFSKYFARTFTDTNFAKKPLKIYTFSEALLAQKKKPRKILFNVTSGFCNTCKVMSKTTFMDSSLADYINKKYYYVEFNAESTDTIVFQNQKYFKGMVNNFPLHNLPLKLSNNRFSLPMTCVLDENFNALDVFNFYLSPVAIKPALYYFGDDHYKTKKWPDYLNSYKSDDKPNIKNK